MVMGLPIDYPIAGVRWDSIYTLGADDGTPVGANHSYYTQLSTHVFRV